MESCGAEVIGPVLDGLCWRFEIPGGVDGGSCVSWCEAQGEVRAGCQRWRKRIKERNQGGYQKNGATFPKKEEVNKQMLSKTRQHRARRLDYVSRWAVFGTGQSSAGQGQVAEATEEPEV